MKRDGWIALALFAVALWQNVSDLRLTPFHPDETRWLNRAHYLRDLADPFGPTWADGYLTRGQPPLGSYLMGLGLLAQGRDLETNGVWNFRYGNAWNAANGNMAEPADLDAGRGTNAVVGALTVVAVYFLGKRLSNRIGGLAAALFLAAHPLMIYLSSQALADALLVLLLALAALALCRLIDRPTWPRAALLGVLLGLGGATKLTPLLLAVLLGLVGLALVAQSWFRRRRIDTSALEPVVPSATVAGGPRADTSVRPYGTRGRQAMGNAARLDVLGLRLVALPVIALVVFVAVYPYLWLDPIGRTANLFTFRVEEMARQGTNWESVAVANRREALRRVGVTLGHRFSATGRLAAKLAHGLGQTWHPPGIDLALALIGAEIWLALAIRGGWGSRHALVLLLLGGQAALIVLGLRSDYARYHLPILLFAATAVGLLAGVAWVAALRLSASLRLRERLYAVLDHLLPSEPLVVQSAAPGSQA